MRAGMKVLPLLTSHAALLHELIGCMFCAGEIALADPAYCAAARP